MKKGETGKCSMCGADIVLRSNNHRFCDACRQLRKTAELRKHYESAREKAKKETARIADSRTRLDDCAKLARKLGVSYGQLMAMQKDNDIRLLKGVK